MLIKLKHNNFDLDVKANKIDFLDARYYQVKKDVYVPSVTTILDAYPKGAAYYDWLKKNGEESDTIRNRAGDRGSAVHGATEILDNGFELNLLDENGYPKYSLQEWSMISKYVEFRKRYTGECAAIEMNLISEELGYAGTLDRIMNINGKLTIVDIKTSNAIYNSYWLQLEAYDNLLNIYGMPVEQVAILWLNAKTRTEKEFQGIGWQLIIADNKDRPKTKELFDATHKLWLAENGSMKPKEFTYSLTYKI